MSEEIYDGVAEIKKKILAKWAGPGDKARAASDAGKLKLVSEHEIVPHKGIGFTSNKFFEGILDRGRCYQVVIRIVRTQIVFNGIAFYHHGGFIF